MFCIRCGAENADDSRFCFKCGAPTPEIMPQAVSTAQYANAPASAAPSPVPQRSRHRMLLWGAIAGVVVATTGVTLFFVLQSDGAPPERVVAPSGAPPQWSPPPSAGGEARLNLGKMASLLERYYDARATDGLFAGFPASERCRGTPPVNNQSVPRNPREVSGRKYQPTEDDWNYQGRDRSSYSAWTMIPFAILQPISYLYCYESPGLGEGSTFTIHASGDLDGDGVWSHYSRSGTVINGVASVNPTTATNENE
jgi:hypothetical protein